ncbi:hypothetical protein R69608_00359 [Paraburkholderia nemoris]|uniref:putative PDDEXK endonuclease n=1 Tax=Paraburkholderia nemoris TaxID=2793076 RepID=UPI0019127C1F|nr:hypothetical protein [Paraburkholderia nemoris]MBK5146369.1 hypothetical protein [Burkholderia sp. R-69608]CAE6864010.1 hypothetical protein R69608_00359 [Paraburkholderia nemoris]
MGLKSRAKDNAGEREIAAVVRDLTGWDIKRRVRQHEGDSDLDGVPGWCAEVKRYATAASGDIREWYAQAARQATAEGKLPVLFYRRDRDEWRAVWPVAVGLAVQHGCMWSGYEWTCEGSVEAWAAVAADCEVKHD